MAKHTFNKHTRYWTYHDVSLPTIIMIHGFRGTHHGLELIAKALPEFHIIIPDLPGFGEGSPLKDGHSIDDYTAWTYDFIKALSLPKPPILLGHSFGSIIAANYAKEYPKTISKLILENPIGAPALEGPRAVFTKLAVAYYWFGRKLPTRLALSLLSSKTSVMTMSVIMAKTKDKNLRKYIHAQHLEHFSTFSDPVSLAQSFKASVSTSVRDYAKDVSVPTLLIAGDKDDITTLGKQKELVKLFPSAKLEIIDNVGHLTHYETPDRVADLIREFTKLL